MKPRIFLIGYRGAGKTSVAKLLAGKLGWTSIDADVVLEERAGKTIRQIFAEAGEPAFRDLESAVLADLAQRDNVVIATGGGVVLRPENRERLKSGVTIWLKSDAESIWRRLQVDPTTAERRPNLTQGGLAEIVELLAKREPLYLACADWSIDGTYLNSPQLADLIAEWLDQASS
ncbi:MAG: shikimate kinase [Gemmataceae bacterium]